MRDRREVAQPIPYGSYMGHDFPHVNGVTHRFVRVNGVNLHIAEAGAGDPVLLLHGWPQHWYMWRHQIPVLARHYTVICPDLRGFGWSDVPRRGYEKERLTDDIVALLDQLGHRSIQMMGHDWGGWIGFLLCLRQPDRVRRYLALNTPHPFHRIDSRVFLLWRFWYQLVIASPGVGSWAVRRQPGIVGHLLKQWLVNHAWTDEVLGTYTGRLEEPHRAHASVQLYRSFLLREFLPTLGGAYRAVRLKTKTLILFGRRDSAIDAALLAGHEPYSDNLTIEIVENAGHCIAEDQPDLVTRRALGFFAS